MLRHKNDFAKPKAIPHGPSAAEKKEEATEEPTDKDAEGEE